MVSNIDSAVIIWNTLITVGKQTLHDKESDSDERSDVLTCATWSKGMNPLR